jgi:hypothetical protein
LRRGGTRLFTAKIWDLSNQAHHEVFWTRLFHAAARRDKGEAIEGAKLMNILETRRRDLVAAPLLAMAAMALRPKPAEAAASIQQ